MALMYVRFPLSLRNVEELLFERRIARARPRHTDAQACGEQLQKIRGQTAADGHHAPGNDTEYQQVAAVRPIDKAAQRNTRDRKKQRKHEALNQAGLRIVDTQIAA
ncbi:MAG: hypothetical protein M0R03_11905 [Novosphingobium sp.]|nr:hypothetical protein [Novosphingobium sp.]